MEESRIKLPFEGALFDLDGTLLDSLYVWKRVDRAFFAKRGMEVPKGYSRKIAGMSYRETAQYTVRNYLPDEDWTAIVAEWIEMAKPEYSECVSLMPGAREYLRALRQSGVKLAVVTALPPALYTPCLRRLGIELLFDAFCSTEELDGEGKNSGRLFQLAAERLGLKPDQCVVFEDTLAGICGAHHAGMRAYCIVEANKNEMPEEANTADGLLHSFEDIQTIHPIIPDRRCVIFTSRCEGDLSKAYKPEAGDYVLCADAGWELAVSAGIRPDLVIGDFDSSTAPEQLPIRRHPWKKDSSDTMLCMTEGLKRGFARFLIVGGFGGRLDHTIGNLRTLAFGAEHHAHVEMRDGNQRAYVLSGPDSLELPKRMGGFSLYALGGRCEGLCIRGALFDIIDGTLENASTLGLSNEWKESKVAISVEAGMLLILVREDKEEPNRPMH